MPANAQPKPHAGPRSAFQTECVAFFAEVVQVFGVPRSLGQIYGLLYASPEPLSFSDIVERLDISKGSASQGLQLLRSLGAINVARPRGGGEREPEGRREADHPAGDGDGSRRVAYEPELSLRRLVGGVLRERVAPLAAAGGDRLGRLRELAAASGGAQDFYLDRAVQLEKWRRRLKAVLPVLAMMLGPKNRK